MLHEIYPTIIIIFTISIAIIALSLSYKRNKKIIVFLERQAVKRNGTITRKHWPSPILTFPYNAYTLVVSFTPGSRHSPPYTIVRTQLNLPLDFYLIVTKEHIGSSLAKKIGMQDIETGNTTFNDSFIIKGSDEYKVIMLLHSSVQQKLLVLKNEKPVIIIRKGRLELKIPKIHLNDEIFDRLIDAVIEIINYSGQF